ncbi:hypothetical protein KEM48_011101 [Puccinia striiformis f. sp. tritici PST-130]|nr:hypothetical protein KEM48_011101 [Puccinia striiformis f. sp. tritici PST-130]
MAQEPTNQPQPRIRHEWYQTDTEVVLSVFIKNTKAEHVSCDFGPRYEIDPSQSSWKSLSSKIDLRLKKKVAGIKWQVIEGEETDISTPIVIQESSTSATRQPGYPSSARRKTNWDELANTVIKEEEEVVKNLKDPNAGGDRALNELFQKLYADATDEQKKAMMKVTWRVMEPRSVQIGMMSARKPSKLDHLIRWSLMD